MTVIAVLAIVLAALLAFVAVLWMRELRRRWEAEDMHAAAVGRETALIGDRNAWMSRSLRVEGELNAERDARQALGADLVMQRRRADVAEGLAEQRKRELDGLRAGHAQALRGEGWAEKVAVAKEARSQGQKARDGR